MVEHDTQPSRDEDPGADTRDAQALIASAEQAAADGDYASAERLLRKAAAAQEATLGPLHPDLANTLNNLGVVCEMRDNPVDAEHYFRRACAIATTVLDPDHPFVATSRKNLEDFCASRGKPVKLSGPVSAIAAGADLPLTAVPHRPADARAVEAPVAVAAARQKPRLLVAAALAAIALLAVASVMWFRTADRVESRASASAPPSPATMAPQPPAAKPAAATPPQQNVATRSARPSVRAQPTPARSAAPRVEPKPTAGTVARSVSPPTVAIAELCRTLSTSGPGGWRCERAQSPVVPGPLVYYTRVKSPADATVLHRWSRGGRVHRVVPLRIRANPVDGYRTYSRQTVTAGASGEWSVALTTSDGTVLHEERFVVR